jgi:hypothetical protein
LFADGLVGFHGDLQPVAEPALELETELDQSSQNEASHISEIPSSSHSKPRRHEGAHSQADQPDQPAQKDRSQTSTRTYISPEYRRRIYVTRPTEVLGLSGDTRQLNLLAVSKSIMGLCDIDEETFERIVRSYPDGAVWYITDTTFTQVRDGIPFEMDNHEDCDKLRSAFPSARQLLFKPVADPTSTKLLGACFVWKNQTSPLFSEASDLASLTAFLHEVESEIARYDATNMVHQRETFVTSVSHELSKLSHSLPVM